MGHELQHIPDLAKLLYLHGVRDVIISPGSRNAPLIRTFHKQFGEHCRSIVDERSAAYFALGQALCTQKPTVLICTSGTAVLNYAPAVAEAFFQGVPLLILSADRPSEWIGQQDNQAIWQDGVFGKNVKASFTLPALCSDEDDLWFVHRSINEAMHRAVSGKPGPIHVNIPLKEPLYERLPEPTAGLNAIVREQADVYPIENKSLSSDWNNAKSILLVSGQHFPDKELQSLIQHITSDKRVVHIAEAVSNLHAESLISAPEIVLNTKIDDPEVARPDLVVYFGGQVVSKKIKLFLRQLKGAKFYAISSDDQIIDTFQNVNVLIQANPKEVLKDTILQQKGEQSGFKKYWKKELRKANKVKAEFSKEIGFSDFKAFKILSEHLPANALVFAGNSTVVRYLSYFDQNKRTFYSNRGTSGIDGCLSSAAGLASKSTEAVYVIVGDLSFAYDSNAFWNRSLPKNLKIVLINNQGGGIFHLLKGPSEDDAFMSLVNAHHPIDFEKLSEAYGLNYTLCDRENSLASLIAELARKKEKAEVLEIATPKHGEPEITKEFFRLLNKK